MDMAALRFVYPPPTSALLTAVSATGLVVLVVLGLLEVRGKHLQYSKFWNVGVQGSMATQIKMESRAGMLISYAPAFLASIAAFLLFPSPSFRLALLISALTIHFFKRICEVLFVHKYSGWMVLNTMILISLSYFSLSVILIYGQHLTQGLPEPAVDLKYAGIVMFVGGISGNFYHHYLLSKLRRKGEKEYKVPRGGLFDVVICPHYLFEILEFIGVSCISQTHCAFLFSLGSTFYLMGRSYATRRWYLSKFEGFSKDVRALIPYVF